MTTTAFEFLRCEYLAGCRYRLDTYQRGERMHYELYDLHSLDAKGFSQVVFEGCRREDVCSVVTAIDAVQSADVELHEETAVAKLDEPSPSVRARCLVDGREYVAHGDELQGAIADMMRQQAEAAAV